MHWACRYIGLPWSATGEGPDTFNCWSFVRHVQARHFGREIPVIPGSADLRALAREFRDHQERRHWREVALSEALPGDAVLLRQARYPIHVGIWLAVDGGGVLHCSRDSGVVYQRPGALLANGWKIDGIYRHRGEA
jgi:cell wall-associated NlpC family hydrolase